MQANPRKTHNKTRSGCVQCKRRKVKCGEEGCPCKNCIKRGLSCTYAQSRPTTTPDISADSPRSYHSTSQQTDRHALGEAQHLHAGLNRQEELCLIHHYTTSTHLGTYRKESKGNNKTAEIWRNMPFRDGFNYPFVLDAVLAVAALHKAYTEPQHGKKYISACLYYQNQCLCGYQEQLTNINEDNCSAMFAVSALVHCLNIAISRGGPTLLPTPPLETLLSQIKLGRGIRIVLESNWEVVRSAHYKDIFNPLEATTPPDAVNSPEVSYAMEELRRCVAEDKTSDATTRNVYATSIDILEKDFKNVEQGENLAAVSAWPIMIDDKLAELLEARDPLMLLICVHYGVLCLHIHDRWWAHNFGCRLIWDLSEMLHAMDASWLPLTSWARAKAASARAACSEQQLW